MLSEAQFVRDHLVGVPETGIANYLHFAWREAPVFTKLRSIRIGNEEPPPVSILIAHHGPFSGH
jgi:hypothetical protein